ncbi:MAG: flagellar hook-associated protein FlgL [Tepidisphaeraceae bacterium]|jgi:flagellar hook-associated protein 3
MAVLPVNLSRVSDLLTADTANQSLSNTQAQLLIVQNELSTGKQVNQPSDNPSAASTILNLTKTLSQRQEYSDNINTAQSQLGVVDTSLNTLSNLLLQAQNIASSDVQSTTTQAQRQGDAQVINSLVTEVQSLANTQSNGVYLFGGANAGTQPYISTAGGIQFVGSSNPLEATVAQNTLMPTEVSGPTIFGGLSTRINGTTNLTPSVTDATQLSSLSGATGQGLALGTIQISNGTVTKTVDLSGAQTLGDVVNDINAADVGSITAGLTSSGLYLSGAGSDNITITDGSAPTATDLGINTGPGGEGAGNALTGTALNPAITPFTPLSTLNNGNGLDNSGFIITNGGVSKTIVPPAGGDMEDLLNAINGAGVGVTAQINSSGTGINVFNATQGTTMTIGENGGTTAAELGIRSFSPSSALSQLNNGQGVGTGTAGTTGDFQITDTNGNTFTVSIAGATTVQDVLNDINSAAATAGSAVVAGFAATGNGITLTDPSGGTGTLSVQPINDSSAAADLGLTDPAASTTSSITGADVDGVQSPGIFSDLQSLASALQTGDLSGITNAAANLQSDYNNVTNVRGVAGAKVDELQNFSSQLQNENIATQTFLSSVQDTNMTQAISQFQTLQTAMQAALLTTAQSQSLSLLNFIG